MMTTVSEQTTQLKQAVQRNCHISDARHGDRYSLCVYLMKMREYYRWEQGLPFGASLPKEEVGKWLQAREDHWDSLADLDYQPLHIGDEQFDPFDSDAINIALEPDRLVYSAGYGVGGAAHFFLAELDEAQDRQGFAVRTAGRELARDLTSPPAMLGGDTVYIRREALKRLLWEKLESWNWSQPDNAMGRAIACFPFESDLDGALEAMTASVIEDVRRHEIGEFRAGQMLGRRWAEIVTGLPRSKAEFLLRAVRDNLADSLEVLPALLDSGDAARLHFYIGNFTPLRKQMWPGVMAAYEQWRESGDLDALFTAMEDGQRHWAQVGAAAVDGFDDDDWEQSQQRVVERIEAAIL